MDHMAVQEIVIGKIGQRLDRVPAEITPESSFVEDLQADPLELTDLMMGLQEEFGIRTECEFHTMTTVADAIRYVEMRLYE